MKIMTAMYTLRRGGAYERFIMMLEAFLERGCEVHCLSLISIPINHPLYRNHVVPLPKKIESGFVAQMAVLFLFPFYLFLIERREKVDLMVAFGPLYAFLGAFTKWVLRKPMVTLIRLEISSGPHRQRFRTSHEFVTKIVECVGLRSSDRIIAINETMRENVLRMFGDRRKVDVRVLPNNIISMRDGPPRDPAETRRRFAIPEQTRLIATAGVLTRRKNFETLIRSLAGLEMKDVFLLIIGEDNTKEKGDYGNDLKKEVGRLDLQERVIFTGWLQKEEMWKIFRSADLFLLSSLNEGMPNVLLEALGLNLPCLGSNIPGIKDVLQYEELMFDPSDEEALSTKIKQFFSDDQYFQKIKGLCQERKRAFLFDWKERMFQAVTEVIRLKEASF